MRELKAVLVDSGIVYINGKSPIVEIVQGMRTEPRIRFADFVPSDGDSALYFKYLNSVPCSLCDVG